MVCGICGDDEHVHVYEFPVEKLVVLWCEDCRDIQENLGGTKVTQIK